MQVVVPHANVQVPPFFPTIGVLCPQMGLLSLKAVQETPATNTEPYLCTPLEGLQNQQSAQVTLPNLVLLPTLLFLQKVQG